MEIPKPIATIKPGDTYELVGEFEIDGVVQDLTYITITSQLLTHSGVLVSSCTITKISDGAGGFKSFKMTLTPAQTANFPVGILMQDIRYTFADGAVETSPTFGVAVEKKVTA